MNDAESASAAASHLEGGSWQSFEWRMRRRRADRCLAAAQQALREGRPQDARAALDEAVRLVPDLSGADAVARRLADAPSGRHSHGRWTAAAVVIAAAGLAFAVRGDWRSALEFQTRAGESAANTRAGAPAPPVAPPATVRIETERISPKVTLDSAPAAVEPPALPDRRVLEARAATDDATPAPAPPVATTSRPETRPQPAAPPVTASAQPKPQPPPPSPLPAPSRDVTVVARAEPSTVPSDTPLTATPRPERAPELPPPAPAVTASAPAATPAAPPEASTEDKAAEEEEAIRAVLSRYAAAYSMLDASAARAVWPAVDERALARAFDSLTSQEVSLSSCDIALVDADAAHANCSGTTTWEPKVGRGPKSQPHRWSFQLARNGSRWAIVDATVK
jgi:hypothetical protein